MICPHCGSTIREEERYLMSRDPDAEIPGWSRYAMYVLGFFILLGGLVVLHAHV